MTSQTLKQLHFVMVPLMSPGHIIPMVDMAILLAQRAVTVTIATTPLNAARVNSVLTRATESGLPIRVLHLRFPTAEARLPEGCESADCIPSFNLLRNFYSAIAMLQEQFEHLFQTLNPKPSCIISDKNLAWTADTAVKFRVPKIVFDGMSCFSQLCTHSLHTSRVYESVTESDRFVVPSLPDRIELTRAQLPNAFNPGPYNVNDVREKIRASELKSHGIVINSFEELEEKYVNEYRKVRGKVWCVGPLSLCNKDDIDKAQRGNESSIDENRLLSWLSTQRVNSVVYACLGSLARVTTPQLVELGLGLEESKHPFIWVVRGGNKDRDEEIRKWILENGFEERNKGKGLVIAGWAPQVLILSHPAIGGFLTHCGWNSTLEGVCVGVPMITWPLFAEQFFNEKLVVDVLGIGVGVGAEMVVHLGEEEKFGVKVRREKVREAIERVMDEGKEGEERRKGAKELGEKGKCAMEEGGSSYLNLTLLIEDILQQANMWLS